MKRQNSDEKGGTLVVTIIVTATLLVLLGVAVDYSTQVSRTTQRSRKTAVAMEIADGHLEALFTNWRNIYRTTWTATAWAHSGGTDYSLVGTNYFYTNCPSCSPTPAGAAPTPIPQMSPSPGATPPRIDLPARSNFPTEPNYTIAQYRIQGVDPMITLDANGNALVEGDSTKKGTGGYVAMSAAAIPPAGYGPNLAFGMTGSGFPYSFFYLAAVDVKVPALTGNVTAKVRRVFEKKFELPWSYAMFYVDDLEFQPSTPLTLTGPVHTNASLYIGSSNFIAANPTFASPTPNPTSGRVEYGADYVNGYSPRDPRYPGSGFTAPTFAKSNASLPLSDCPPSQVSPFLPFGWNLKVNLVGNENESGGYHEIIERPNTLVSDPLKNVRYYSQPGYQVVIGNDTTGTGGYTVTKLLPASSATPSPTPQNVTGTAKTKLVGNSGGGDSETVFRQGKALNDVREGGFVKVTDVDISKIVSNLSSLNDWTGLLYIADSNATTYNSNRTVKNTGTPVSVTIGGVTQVTTRRAFRLINATHLPAGGLTIVSENPIYIQGDYNTGATLNSSTKTYNTPSDNADYTRPTVSGYNRVPSAIVADAITVLSANWEDSKSILQSSTSRNTPTNTTINAALVTGNVPSSRATPGGYSGGGENFIRLLEDWSSRSFCYYGSMVQLFQSNQAIGYWNSSTDYYVAPQTSRWYYDYATFADAAPPGNLQVAAYLQQQRWYQVY